MNLRKNLTLITVALALLITQLAYAAAGGKLTNVRFSASKEAVRFVFDVSSIPEYRVTTALNGTTLIVDLPDTVKAMATSTVAVKDPLVKSCVVTAPTAGTARITIELTRNAVYKINHLKNPNRVYIDIVKIIDQQFVQDIADGLKQLTIVRSNNSGMWTINVLDIDMDSQLQLRPVLAKNKILERDTLSNIAKNNKAVAAVNASYFEKNGEISGVFIVDSTIASTTYLKRAAFGVTADGTAKIGMISYDGTLILPRGERIPVSGVNVGRTENAVVIYNSYYADSTKTNIYGKEFIIKGGEVAQITKGNAPLDKQSVVISAHGSSVKLFENLRVGDQIGLEESLSGDNWDNAVHILGAGPLLVKDGKVVVDAASEQFGPDVAKGRAPRTAVGITKEGHVLLVAVDGRQAHSVGYTLEELASFMLSLGAVDAMNFDGGGSTEMIVDGDIVNKPSDQRERLIGSALVVVGKK